MARGVEGVGGGWRGGGDYSRKAINRGTEVIRSPSSPFITAKRLSPRLESKRVLKSFLPSIYA